MTAARVRRQHPPITYRDRQDRVWSVSEVAVLKVVALSIDGPNLALVIRVEHLGEVRFAHWLGDSDWRAPVARRQFFCLAYLVNWRAARRHLVSGAPRRCARETRSAS